ncbi:MAG TPA: hypothetical protein VHM65_10315 [Candidatus Lustribacter sp.]|nr:hypothetical protein [Candidatus Lustribacter sp.]
MTTPHLPSDAELLDLLREGLTTRDDVPASVYDAGYAAYSWRTIDVELAALMYDSAADLTGSGARSEQAAVRAMTFTTAVVTIEIEIGPGEVLGQLNPGMARQVTVEVQDSGPSVYPVNEVGGFVISPLPSSPFRLLVEVEGHTVVTGWVSR